MALTETTARAVDYCECENCDEALEEGCYWCNASFDEGDSLLCNGRAHYCNRECYEEFKEHLRKKRVGKQNESYEF